MPGVNAATMLPRVRAALAGIKDAVVIVVNPPPVQGLGAAGGFKLMVEDRGDHTPQELADCDQRAGRGGQQGSGIRRCLHPLQRRRALALRRHRPRESGEGRPHADRRVLDPAALSRLAVRERLQLSGSHLPGARPGRRTVPQDAGGHRPAQGPQRQRRDGADRLGRELQGQDRALSAAALQPLSGRRVLGARGTWRRLGHGHETDGGTRQGSAARRASRWNGRNSRISRSSRASRRS